MVQYLVLASSVGFVHDGWTGRLDGEEDERVGLRSVSAAFFSLSSSHQAKSGSILNACWTCRIAVDSP